MVTWALTCLYKISGPIYKMTAIKKVVGEHPGREKEIKEREKREYKTEEIMRG